MMLVCQADQAACLMLVSTQAGEGVHAPPQWPVGQASQGKVTSASKAVQASNPITK